MLTEDMQQKIRQILPAARSVAKGSMDPLHDVIIDAEAIIRGNGTLARGPREEVAAWIVSELERAISSRLTNGLARR